MVKLGGVNYENYKNLIYRTFVATGRQEYRFSLPVARGRAARMIRAAADLRCICECEESDGQLHFTITRR